MVRRTRRLRTRLTFYSSGPPSAELDAALSYAKARLAGADLSDAALAGADLSFADLRDAHLDGTRLEDSTAAFASIDPAHASLPELSGAIAGGFLSERQQRLVRASVDRVLIRGDAYQFIASIMDGDPVEADSRAAPTADSGIRPATIAALTR